MLHLSMPFKLPRVAGFLEMHDMMNALRKLRLAHVKPGTFSGKGRFTRKIYNPKKVPRFDTRLPVRKRLGKVCVAHVNAEFPL